MARILKKNPESFDLRRKFIKNLDILSFFREFAIDPILL